MGEPRSRFVLWALSLIAGGVILLLFNFGLLNAYTPWPQALLAGGCGLGAVVLFGGFARHGQEWWRLLPAWTLVALASMVLTGSLGGFDRALIAAQLLAGLALAFGNVYLLARQERWWALLPGGFMLVLAVVVAASHWLASVELLAALLFGGLGLVFFLLYLLDSKRRQWWALIPGSVLLVFGVLALTANSLQEGGVVRWWPSVLVAAGLLVLAAGRRTPARADRYEVNNAPRSKAGAARPAPALPRASLGEYTQPAPGASIDILPDND